MRKIHAWIFAMALCCGPLAAQGVHTNPWGPPHSSFDRSVSNPPVHLTPKLDVTKLREQAEELRTLSLTIPADVNAATRGLIAKDLGEKLKRIEKLSKKLRQQLNP
jgi:hypothetical protein